MITPRRNLDCALARVVVLIFLSASALGSCKSHLIIAGSEHISRPVSYTRATELLCNLAAQMQIDPDQLKLVLIQIPPADASIVQVTQQQPIREIHQPNQSGSIYLVWFIGNEDDLRLAGLLASALADSAGRRPTPKDFDAAVRRALRITDAAVNLNSLLDPSH